MPQRYELNKTQRIALFDALSKARESAEIYVNEWTSYAPATFINQAKLSESLGQLEYTMNLIALEDRTYRTLISEYNSPRFDPYEVAQRMADYFRL